MCYTLITTGSNDPSKSQEDETNGGMIAMGVVIAALAIMLIAFLVVFLIRRRYVS